jgi:hypothetical protein
MKKIFLMLLITTTLFSQENKIVDLLNNQLQKEIKTYRSQDTIKLIKPFHIDQNKKLSFEYEIYNNVREEWRILKYEVALNKINGFIKDVNVIFTTEQNDVLLSVKIYNIKKEFIEEVFYKKDMFFTEISFEQNNTNFRDDILAAFKKTGYTINSEYWYD